MMDEPGGDRRQRANTLRGATMRGGRPAMKSTRRRKAYNECPGGRDSENLYDAFIRGGEQRRHAQRLSLGR